MLNCQDVADYFLVLVDREAGDTITQLKLHKLVYFAQGISLALFNKPLFENPIMAWKHGPVVLSLRKKFGAFENNPIPSPAEIDFDLYKPQEKELIYKVYSSYGEHSASYLRNLTHKHPIWIEAFNSENNLIDHNKIKEFFKTVIDHNFLLMSEQDKQNIINAEDEWWMHYDSGVPAEDVHEEILRSIQKLKEEKGFEYKLV